MIAFLVVFLALKEQITQLYMFLFKYIYVIFKMISQYKI